MNPDTFHPKQSTGRLVKAQFHKVGRRDGQLEEIHEDGWAFIPGPMPELNQILEQAGSLFAVHEQAMAMIGRLDGIVQSVPGGLTINPWVLYQPLRLREARLSSKIENTIASASEIEAVSVIPTKRSEPLEVRNYFRAIEMGAQSQSPVNEAMIRALHTELLKDVPDSERKFPGQYRPLQVMIGDDGDSFTNARFVPPPPEEVPLLMQQLVEYMRDPPIGMPMLFVAAIAHYQFEAIHPFADGNGRLGRMLITLSLCNNNLLAKPLIYPSGYINKHKQQYYDLLLGVSTHGGWAAWIEYFLKVVLAESQGTVDRIHRLFQLRQDYLSRIGNSSRGQRFTDSVDYLFKQSVITVKMLHKHIGGTEQTARNYVDLMLECGILHHLERGTRTKFYFAPEIHMVVDED
ncbi:hypothetical protein COB72_06880 [bacterium]|nr:MAG: hypothetical protein COB72_06880 [bacterium]